jgi:hypothetical protein
LFQLVIALLSACYLSCSCRAAPKPRAVLKQQIRPLLGLGNRTCGAAARRALVFSLIFTSARCGATRFVFRKLDALAQRGLSNALESFGDHCRFSFFGQLSAGTRALSENNQPNSGQQDVTGARTF